MDPTRAMGHLLIGEGVIIRAHPQTDDRTAIELAPDIFVGSIIRDSTTMRWRYDDQLRSALGITGNPDFETDAKAGGALREHLPPLSQVRSFAQSFVDSGRGGSS